MFVSTCAWKPAVEPHNLQHVVRKRMSRVKGDRDAQAMKKLGGAWGVAIMTWWSGGAMMQDGRLDCTTTAGCGTGGGQAGKCS